MPATASAHYYPSLLAADRRVCVCVWACDLFPSSATEPWKMALPYLTSQFPLAVHVFYKLWTRTGPDRTPKRFRGAEKVWAVGQMQNRSAYTLSISHTHNGDLSVELDTKRSKGIRSFSDTKWTHIFEIITNHTMKMQQSDPFSLDLFTVRDL